MTKNMLSALSAGMVALAMLLVFALVDPGAGAGRGTLLCLYIIQLLLALAVPAVQHLLLPASQTPVPCLVSCIAALVDLVLDLVLLALHPHLYICMLSGTLGLALYLALTAGVTAVFWPDPAHAPAVRPEADPPASEPGPEAPAAGSVDALLASGGQPRQANAYRPAPTIRTAAGPDRKPRVRG